MRRSPASPVVGAWAPKRGGGGTRSRSVRLELGRPASKISSARYYGHWTVGGLHLARLMFCSRSKSRSAISADAGNSGSPRQVIRAQRRRELGISFRAINSIHPSFCIFTPTTNPSKSSGSAGVSPASMRFRAVGASSARYSCSRVPILIGRMGATCVI
ncbi:hypothetical protein FKP32DRAFT_303789 [Trametes sanguinea]|nr:hypothetical protein FKP32DRAFT_303789 [Trametes sanguinea]